MKKYKILGIGEACPKCRKEMQRRTRADHIKPKTTYYFKEWDTCSDCSHVQHYDKYKKWTHEYVAPPGQSGPQTLF